MSPFLFGLFTWLSTFFRSRYNLSLEIIALRQQLGVLKRKTPRPRLRMRDRIFWILLHRLSHRRFGQAEVAFCCAGTI